MPPFECTSRSPRHPLERRLSLIFDTAQHFSQRPPIPETLGHQTRSFGLSLFLNLGMLELAIAFMIPPLNRDFTKILRPGQYASPVGYIAA